MRVLCITHYAPYPPDHGGALRVFGLLRALAAKHDVHLLAPSVADELGVRAEAFPMPRDGPTGGGKLWARALARATPPWVLTAENPAMRRRTHELAADFDAIVFFDDYAGAYASGLDGPAPVVADTPFVLGADANPPGMHGLRERAFHKLGQHLERRYERRYHRNVDALVVTSQEDARRLERTYGEEASAVVASAVDVPPAVGAGNDRRRIAWLGSLDGRPIVDGLVRFVEEAWEPLGRDGFELLIAGRGTPPAVRRLERFPGVQVLGYMDDLDAFLGSAGAAVIPLWGGQGVKLKTLTVLGAGLPTAATPLALEGIPAVHGEQCLIGDTPEALGAALASIASDDSLARRLAERGRALVRDEFSWDVVGPRFVKTVEQAVAAGKR